MKELKYLNICYNLKENDEKLHACISSYTNKLFKYNNQNELINLITSENINLIITKYNFEFLKEIRKINHQIQIIAILDEINNAHLLEGIDLEYIKFIQELNCANEIIDSLKNCVKNIDSNKSNVINLNHNFIYDNYNYTLLKKGQIIPLTKKESLFLNYLLKNSSRALSYDEIDKEIWSGSMSQDALRSLIKELRKKTYKELIKNVSGIGYRIDF
jgi:two-component system, OmpR family, response regulator VanR